MANHVVLQVMGKIAARHGFSSSAPETKQAGTRLTEDEQAMLRRAIRGEPDDENIPRHPGTAAPHPAAVSLEQLADQKR